MSARIGCRAWRWIGESSRRMAGTVGSAPPVNTPTECPPSPALSTRSNLTATLSGDAGIAQPGPGRAGLPDVAGQGEGEPVAQPAGLALLAEDERGLERPDVDPVGDPDGPGLERPVGQHEVVRRGR